MANGFSPYQVASPIADLIGQTNISKKKKQESNLATTLQMGRMEDAYSKETEGLGLSSAKKEAGTKGTRRAESIAQLASLFINPLLGGLIGGFIGGKKHRRARKARQGLLNLNEKWGKTFLRNQARDYLSDAESLQLSEGGDFMAGLKSGVTSGLMAKMLGGKIKGGEGGSFADKFFGRDVKGFSDTLTSSTQKLRDADFLKWDEALPAGSKKTLSDFSFERPGFFDGSKLFGGAKGIDTKTLLLLPALLQLFEQDY